MQFKSENYIPEDIQEALLRLSIEDLYSLLIHNKCSSSHPFLLDLCTVISEMSIFSHRKHQITELR